MTPSAPQLFPATYGHVGSGAGQPVEGQTPAGPPSNFTRNQCSCHRPYPGQCQDAATSAGCEGVQPEPANGGPQDVEVTAFRLDFLCRRRPPSAARRHLRSGSNRHSPPWLPASGQTLITAGQVQGLSSTIWDNSPLRPRRSRCPYRLPKPRASPTGSAPAKTLDASFHSGTGIDSTPCSREASPIADAERKAWGGHAVYTPGRPDTGSLPASPGSSMAA